MQYGLQIETFKCSCGNTWTHSTVIARTGTSSYRHSRDLPTPDQICCYAAVEETRYKATEVSVCYSCVPINLPVAWPTWTGPPDDPLDKAVKRKPQLPRKTISDNDLDDLLDL